MLQYRTSRFILACAIVSGGGLTGAVRAADTVVRYTFNTYFYVNGAYVNTLDVQLLDSQAPLTVNNFLKYVVNSTYNNTIIHRNVAGFVVQGGGFDASFLPIANYGTVPNEFSPTRSNVAGTLAMAKQTGDPNSASNNWFFNVVDNSGSPNNLDSTNGGYTVFGDVVADANGNNMAVLTAMNNISTYNATIFGSAFDSLPLLIDTSSNTVGLVMLTKLSFVNAPVSGGWNGTAGTSLWGTAANWTATTVADGVGSTATFAVPANSGTLALHLDDARTLGHLTFGGGTSLAGWALDNNGVATNILTLMDTATPPTITVNALGTGNVATISAVLAGGQGFIKNGAGTLVLSGANIYSGGTTVNGGTLTFATASARPAGDKLTINRDSGTGKGSMVVIGGDAANLDSYRTALAASFTSSAGVWTWTNGGLVASTDAALPANAHQGIGYMTGTQYLALHPGAAGINPNDVVLRYTYLGDTSLKGYIDASDFAQLDASYLKNIYTGVGAAPKAQWINGDFNYDGKIDASDFAILDAAYVVGRNGTLASDPFYIGNLATFGPGYSDLVAAELAAMAPVPEPAALGLLGLGMAGLWIRRRPRGS